MKRHEYDDSRRSAITFSEAEIEELAKTLIDTEARPGKETEISCPVCKSNELNGNATHRMFFYSNAIGIPRPELYCWTCRLSIPLWEAANIPAVPSKIRDRELQW